MRDSPRSLMIFAAGLGTRMRPLTETRPKPLIAVAGKTLLDHALDFAEGAGVSTIVVNTHYLADQIAQHLRGQDVKISYEPKLLDTGGGLRAARPLLGAGPVFTLNSDTVWDGPNPLRVLAETWQKAVHQSLLLCVEKTRALGHVRDGDFLAGPPVKRGPGVVYTGAQILAEDVDLDRDGDVFSLNRIWDRHLEEGSLGLAAYPGRWCDVGQPDSLDLAEAMCRDV